MFTNKQTQNLKRFLFLYILCLLSTAHPALGRIPKLSTESNISLLTCAPGTLEVYQAFGHTAIRVYDPVNRIDRAYNYGTFDYRKPNFYLNYAMGRPIFSLSVWPMGNFMEEYEEENRRVEEDIFNLTQDQKQRLFELLVENSQPANRDYRYDYIYDNCATRIRDILIKVMDGKLVFDTTRKQPVYTFRQLMDLYLDPQPWGDFGIDLALSSVIDTPTTPYYYMFLPDFLRDEIKNAKIVDSTAPVPFVKETLTLYEATPKSKTFHLFQPLYLFWLLFLLFAIKTFRDFRKEEISFAFDMAFFALIGLTGALIAHISFFSDHHAARNYNLLWAIPTHLLFAFLIPSARRRNWVRYYFLITLIITTIAFIGGFTFIPQQFNTAFYPIMLVLMMRSWMIYRKTSEV